MLVASPFGHASSELSPRTYVLEPPRSKDDLDYADFGASENAAKSRLSTKMPHERKRPDLNSRGHYEDPERETGIARPLRGLMRFPCALV